MINLVSGLEFESKFQYFPDMNPVSSLWAHVQGPAVIQAPFNAV